MAEAVLADPSSDRFEPVYETHNRNCREDEKTLWWDDTLTPEEEDFLCGVYTTYESGYSCSNLFCYG